MKKNLENLKSNWSKYNYPDSLIKQGFQKALSIPQKDLQKPKKPSNRNILPFIKTFNLNNPNIYSNIKSSVNCLRNNSISGLHNIKLIQSKRQPPNLKKNSTYTEYGEILSGTFNCSDKRGQYCNYLLTNVHYTFKYFKITQWQYASSAHLVRLTWLPQTKFQFNKTIPLTKTLAEIKSNNDETMKFEWLYKVGS